MRRALAFVVGGVVGLVLGHQFLLDGLDRLAFSAWRQDLEWGTGFFGLETVLRSSVTWKLLGPMLLFGVAAVAVTSVVAPRKKSRRRASA